MKYAFRSILYAFHPLYPQRTEKSADKLSDRVMKLNDGININRVRGDKLWI